MVFLFLVCLALPLSVNAENLNKRKTASDWPLLPMNCPIGKLGVTGHDGTLCRDRWSLCSSYERQLPAGSPDTQWLR